MEDVIAEASDSGQIATDPNGFVIIHASDSNFRRVQATEVLTIPDGIGINNTIIPMGPAVLADRMLAQSVSLNDMMSSFDAATQTALNNVDGTSANFPSFSNQNGGGHTFAFLSDFEWASILTGNMSLSVTNNIPADITSLQIDIVDTDNSNVVGSYTFALVATGASLTGNATLIGKTFGKELRLDITNIGCSGTTTAVNCDLNDDLDFELNLTSMISDEGQAQLEPQVLGGDSIPISFSLPNNEEATRFWLSQGDMDMTILSSIGANMRLVVNFPTAENSGNSVIYITDVDGNQTTNMTHSLANVDIDLSTDPSSPYNVLPVTFNIANAGSTGIITYNAADEMDVSVAMNGLEYNMIEGYFGTRQENLDVADVIIDMPELFGGIDLFDPVMQLLTINSFGFPIEMNLDFDGFGKDSVRMNTTPQTIPYPTFQAQGAVSGAITYDNTNSDIEEFMENIPNRISPVNGMAINPNGNQGYTNFLAGDAFLQIGFDFQMPVKLGFYSFGFMEIQEFEGVNLGVDTLEDGSVDTAHLEEIVEHAYFHVNTLNAFGTDVDITIYMMDDFLQKLDSIKIPLMTSAALDANGAVVSPSFTKNIVEIDNDQLAALGRAQNLGIKGILNTPPQGVFHLHETNYVKLFTGIEVKIKTTLE
jgi:hypothetical protein